MDRGERRARTERAKRRKLCILYGHATGPNYAEFARPLTSGCDYIWAEHPWRGANRLGAYMMSSCPKAWRKAMMIRPARAEQNQMLRDGKFEGLFPDYRKPHIYYW